MSKINIFIFCLFGVISVSVGQYIQIGQCDPNIQLVQDFNIDEFLGTWYELARSDNPNQNGDCTAFELTRTNDTINVYHSMVTNNFFGDGNGTASFANGTAKLSLNISLFEEPMDFWVQLTDYTNFALASACQNITTTQRRVYIWVLGRSRVFPNEMIPALINTTINNSFGINALTLKTVNHGEDGCYILPVIEAGQPIILPGQCDPNIAVVQNFSVEDFTGIWHQIASYQNSNSAGSCVRAEYTQSGGVINVFNRRVLNEALSTISGTAVVNSNQSAKLLVTLNTGAGPQTQDLWILATDYNSYAISYSCTNQTDNEKRVYSWILSRTRQIAASAQVEVDRVVNSIIDLNYQYYEQTNQTDAGCFFYPVPVPNQPVVFGGQCASVNVQAMSNFDAARYMGLWHTIEMYPMEFQDGTCSNAFYELVDGRVDVLNTQVINETLGSINAVAVPSSTDGTAKLLVTFHIPGTNLTVSSEYWVLSTDYTNYALVYSCFDINADEMRVGSWKLSRTKQLTPASETVINAVMNNTLVLDQRYYEPENQSVESCFYFPEPMQGVPVVFPGQCDDSIAAVPNFNMTQFVGLWYEIESYPKEEQLGNCSNHQFTVDGLGNITLQSSNIYDQALGITNGTVRLNSTDGSGRMIINVTLANGTAIEIPYWILSTDYTDYALAYSCVNIDTDFRTVYSWKLSRTKELSTAANTSINNAISNINVLDNEYYENIDQSERACFYFPADLTSESIVILPGQCDTSIRGVANFNISAYAGRWRLIESYRNNHQSGTCNIARYNLQSSDTLAVTNSQVTNERLGSIFGTATLNSTDGTGKLIFKYSNRNREFEFYVLDTDYTSYALGYGCVNLNSEQRTVYSWKLSRENTLSQEAINRINQVIDNIDVLNNRYYYIVNRTASGCFYYPTADNNSAVTFPGQCDESIPVVTNFDAGRYLGLWHDIESFPRDFQDGTCINAYYGAGNDVDVFNTQVINQTLFSLSGSAVLMPSTNGSAKLNVTFNVGGFDVSTEYWVLATDYDSYSFVYSCRNVDDEFQQVTAWKLSRTKALTTAATTAINNVISTLPILDQRYYLARNQTPEGCFYFPEPQLGVPVVFPGQCDDTIAAVPNFNMNQFQGVWYEIEAYPKEEQRGQCINHQFTSNSVSNLDLLSLNVYDQTLNVTSGNVRFNSTDGSGRLIINITANGTAIEIPYWILSTDYTDYALAYSCVNIGTDYRGVWSWKLSRTKQLSAAANTSINNAISNINVLDNRYYENIDQSDRACFYLPDIAPGEAVVFPGQCDTNITGMANFNITAYAGRWRLVESYASNFQVGTCNIARYTLLSNDTLEVTNSQVVNQALGTISGTARINSTDGTGKFLFYYPSVNRDFEFIVLDTDYTSYALGYGCVNLSSEEKRVYSWKLSRENTLSQEATNRINQVIDNIDVLNNRFYYIVNRTVSGCFYYPTVNSNSTVIFPGQCDESIPVVTNFDAGRYLGLWHDIESFPGDFQDGTCINAYYSAGNDVDVFNTQVIDQTLFVLSGSAVLVPSTNGSAKLNVTFNVGGFDVWTGYWVLATDYDSYSFVYSCRNVDDEFQQVTAWKLSRTKALTAAATTAINNVISTLPILDQRYYLARNQTPEGCFYFPEPQLGVPVVFPGQCDDSIAAVPNFNMSQFQGIWHEIEAYPKEEQPGQCINHQFTSNNVNNLDLLSFNVYDQTLNVTSGNVRFNSTDGSGRLIITITANGTVIEIPYWILSTDYTDYALAYSCVNIDTDYRGVWSWKLSRTKQLSPAANTSINNAISNINVLDNRYYENIDQSDQACFYLPDIAPGEAVILPGQCDTNITGMANFNITAYAGRWRLIESYASNFQVGTCNVAQYNLLTNDTLEVTNSQVVNQALGTISGTARINSTDGTGKFLFHYPSVNRNFEFIVLDTDYTSYALGYGCVNLNSEERRVYSWKLSRENTLSQAAANNISQFVNNINVLHQPYYYIVNRTDAACFYFPTPTSDSVVVFPGQCDQAIPVVSNFNASLYSGLWHDVESYPTTFQNGTCNRATFAVTSANTGNVVNTQVVNQILQNMTGSAVAATTDGSAKFDVTYTLSSGVVNTSYWILDTDYTSYSLVYSCRNIDQETREVYSWKLGRQPTLTAAANTSINNVINNVQVLDQRYYVQRRHTEEDCFYYPDNQGGDVLLRGQCVPDAEVPAITNFNANLFAGTWHEVARFPSPLQNGECISNQYTLNGSNVFNVIKTSVINETQLTTSTQATVASNGRGVITVNISGVPFNDIYILATDYSEYALAYSCRNIDNDWKQVYSWKLSRSRAGLSAAANTVIDQLVSNNIDLHEPYYRYTNQDNAACFYYPEFDQLPSTIELPGPCNTTIRGIPNFNSSAYLGRWFEMARYPQTAQSGQCNRAEYSDIGNAVGVVNSQVINMTLATISGTAQISSTDGSGQYEVTFNVGGEIRRRNYTILATDYDNYALVYTCVNLDNGNRQVGSWKLSRTRTLSALAISTMDAVINETQGLRENYYQTTSQSDESCFYVPAVNATQAPLFRGQCEDIAGMAGFNVQSYLGWWHEIERYPSDGDVGGCLSSRYEASGNTIQVVDTSIFDLSAVTVNGTVTVTNNGRLRRVLSDNRVQDIWVLATDYNTYALLYSCENVNDEYRRVWSAKHSKARSLTPAAEAAMAPVIASNRLLYPQFYQPVDQSDSACFHYPTQTGSQVILRGQCDDNIPVVSNFQMAEFQGTWYQIERYDAVVDSTCAGTRYGYDAVSGNITVLEYEVIDGVLRTREGSAQLATDGSGKLSLVMPDAATNGTVTSYMYILTTDYENYALAYSCVNVDEFHRRVGAWKLSRERSLSAGSNTAINAIVTQREELHQPYFNQISQDENCSEPSSSFLIKSSIIVVLVCTALQLVW